MRNIFKDFDYKHLNLPYYCKSYIKSVGLWKEYYVNLKKSDELIFLTLISVNIDFSNKFGFTIKNNSIN